MPTTSCEQQVTVLDDHEAVDLDRRLEIAHEHVVSGRGTALRTVLARL